MRAMNDTISKFSALAFRNKRILSLSKKVILDVIPVKYSVFGPYSSKNGDFRRNF